MTPPPAAWHHEPRPFSLTFAARDAPERTALVYGQRQWTFPELLEEAGPFLDLLRSARDDGRLLPHNLVALTGDPRPEALFALYALFELEQPALLLHPRLSPEEHEDLARRAGATLVFHTSQEAFLEDVTPVPISPPPSREAVEEPPPKTQAPRFPGILAVLYTSGSSGRPKAVALSRQAFAVAAEASAANLGWQEDDRWLLAMPVAHVGGLSIVTRCLADRRCVVLSEHGHFTAEGFAREVEERRVTLASLVPTMLHRLLEASPPWTPPKHLRAILLGGAAASPGLLQEAGRREAPVLTTYGLTEACSQVTTQSYREMRSRAGEPPPPGCGSPLPGTDVRVKDGEVQVRGPTLMEGYLPLEEGTSFRSGRWLATGDLGRLDDGGHLHVLGRTSERIVSGGENVDPAQVETVLRSHPAIQEACVFGVEDAEWGELVCAALVLQEGRELPPAELARWIRSHLPSFRRPRRLAFLASLPFLPSGKVDRRAVVDQAETRLQDPSKPG